VKFKGVEYEALNNIYKNLVDLVGCECAEKLYDHYRGQQLNFSLKLCSAEYIKKTVTEQGENCDIKRLSRELGYTERWIKKLAAKDDGSSICQRELVIRKNDINNVSYALFKENLTEYYLKETRICKMFYITITATAKKTGTLCLI
jgi:hypothetical protein